MTAALHLPDREEWTVDDLSELPPDLTYELINGRLLVPSATPPHQDLGVRVLLALEANCPADHLAVTDLSVQVNRHNEPRPEVVAIRIDHADRSPVPVSDVVLAVEIISPESTFRDMEQKVRLYAAAGIPTYWVIDPLHGAITLTEFVRDHSTGQYEFGVHTADVFETDRPWPVRLDLPALTARRAALLERIHGPAASPED